MKLIEPPIQDSTSTGPFRTCLSKLGGSIGAIRAGFFGPTNTSETEGRGSEGGIYKIVHLVGTLHWTTYQEITAGTANLRGRGNRQEMGGNFATAHEFEGVIGTWRPHTQWEAKSHHMRKGIQA